MLFRVAAGGMAEVYAARVHGEAGFEKLVAVKRMLPTLADDEEFVSMFLDEAKLAANISSPHVVQTLDLGRDESGALYIAMELVVGVTLGRIMKEASKVRRAVPVPMAVELLAQSAVGLHAAHVATTPIGQPLDIVHRDVSPQNILVGIDGRARLTDFGVARAVLRSTQTVAGRIKGKFAYCAPEQLRSDNVDQRADIFALGVVAWEALAGQRLFVADHPLATMERVTTMPIIPLDQVRAKVPKAVADVVDKALQRDREARHETAQDFAYELRHAATSSGLVLPTQAEVSRFVKAAGGEPLQRMRSNIQAAMANSPSSEFAISDDSPSVISSSGTADTDVIGKAHSTSEPDASGIARIPGSLFPGVAVAAPVPSAEESPEPRLPPVAKIAALALLLGAAIGVAASFFASGESPSTPLASPIPTTEADPEGAPSQIVVEEPLVVANPDPDPAPDLDFNDLDLDQQDLEQDLERESVDSEPEPTERRRRTRSRRTQTETAMNDTAMVETAMVETAMVETAMATPMTTQTVSPMEAPTMRGPLVGLDAFDREANQ